MDSAERREYARRVMANPTHHYIDEPHLDGRLQSSCLNCDSFDFGILLMGIQSC